MSLPRRATQWLVALPLAVLLCPAPVRAYTVDEAMRAANEKYGRGDLNGAREDYMYVLRERPTNFTALHRLSRVESELGEDAEGEGQRLLAAKAVEHARAAVAAAGDSAQGHLALAVALGRQALKEGPRTKLSLSREIKSEVDRALAIDPRLGRAYHVRAVWNRKIASLSFMERAAARAVLGGVPHGASMDNAVRDFEKAIELEPHYVNHHLELARTFKDMDRNDDARRELERALALPPTSNPRDLKYQAEAREMLSKISKKH